MEPQDSETPFPWHHGVYDAHCHPTDAMNFIDDIPKMKTRILTIMATRSQDQDLVARTADRMGFDGNPSSLQSSNKQKPCQILPSFGWHPWFSHQLYDDLDGTASSSSPPTKSDHYQATLNPRPSDPAFISSLPDPLPLSALISRTKAYLTRYPHALVGEIGLDKSFRIPHPDAPPSSDAEPDLTPGGREGRCLSPHRVDMAHQRRVLLAQLRLAGEMQRAVSVHGVAAHGLLFDTLASTWKGHEREVVSRRRKRRHSVEGAHDHEGIEEGGRDNARGVESKPFPPRICLHSYSGPPETLKQYFNPAVPAHVFLSFSQVINFSTPASEKALAVIKAVPDDRVLVESDLHCAGERMDGLLRDMVVTICEAKGWDLEEGTKQLARNWMAFALGHE